MQTVCTEQTVISTKKTFWIHFEGLKFIKLLLLLYEVIVNYCHTSSGLSMSCWAFFYTTKYSLLDILLVSLQKILYLFLESAYAKIQSAFRSIVAISLSTNCLVTRSCGTWYSVVQGLNLFCSIGSVVYPKYSFKTCDQSLVIHNKFIDWTYIIFLKLLDK